MKSGNVKARNDLRNKKMLLEDKSKKEKYLRMKMFKFADKKLRR